MITQSFYVQYQKAIMRMARWLSCANTMTSKNTSEREDYGYDLEQLLMQRDLAIEKAKNQNLVDIVDNIKCLDNMLLKQSSRIRKMLGIDVLNWLKEK